MANEVEIYLLDKDSSARKGLHRLLKAAGYRVNAYSSYSQLKEDLDTSQPRCLILDSNQDSEELDSLRLDIPSEYSSLNIVVLSGEDHVRNEKMARRIGASFLLRKPVDGPALIDTIKWISGNS